MDEDLKIYLDQKFGAIDQKFGPIDQKFEAIDQKFEAIDQSLAKNFEAIDQKFAETEARLVEKMRDMQTELLRGFEAFSAGQAIRLRKVEADQSNLDSALSGRVAIVENRLSQIEQRLGLQ